METQKATVYFETDVGGFAKMEGHLADHGYTKYAQFARAAFFVMKPKGKQKFRKWVKGYSPTYFIVKGWNHPDMPTPSEYIAFSGASENNFNLFVESLNADIIADYRTGVFN